MADNANCQMSAGNEMDKRAGIATGIFPSLDALPEEFEFLEEYKSLLNNGKFSNDAFKMVNSQEVLLSQINMVEEPIVRRVLLDDYHRTFVDDESGYKKSMRALLQSQLDALGE